MNKRGGKAEPRNIKPIKPNPIKIKRYNPSTPSDLIRNYTGNSAIKIPIIRMPERLESVPKYPRI